MKKLLCIFFLPLSACSLAPSLDIPTSDVPADWKFSSNNQVSIEGNRWEDFGSEELDALITRALAHNTDIRAALARVEQAKASAVIAGSGLFPAIDASIARSGEIYRDDNAARDRRTQGAISISYELDIWQRNMNARRAGQAQLAASRFDQQAVALITVSETARLYTGALALSTRAQVAGQTLGAAREILRITRARYDAGAISGLELSQQQSAVASAQAGVESIMNQRNLFLNQLALLTGSAPSGFTINATDMSELQLPAITMADPWELLSRRPDIARSEALLRAANINIGVARADALPSLQLGLDTAITTDPTTTTSTLAGSFFAPIFRGGALQAEIRRSEASYQEALANYRGVLLASFREVEDALTNYETSQSRLLSLSEAAGNARKAYDITNANYRAGAIDFQTLLDTQRTLLQTEDAQISAKQDAYAAAIDLFRALGGPLGGS